MYKSLNQYDILYYIHKGGLEGPSKTITKRRPATPSLTSTGMMTGGSACLELLEVAPILVLASDVLL
jgi:hypothetical protein